MLVQRDILFFKNQGGALDGPEEEAGGDDDTGYEQIERTVESKNRRALGLYHRFGFTVYGTRPHGMKYPDGSYDNDYLMIKMLHTGRGD